MAPSSLRVLQKPRQWCHPRMLQSPALPPSVQPGQGSAPDLNVQCQLDPTRDQAGSTWGPASPANSIPAQSSLLASGPPTAPPELGKLRCPPQPISPPVPPARSEEPAALLGCQQASKTIRGPTSSKGCWDSLPRTATVCPRGHGTRPLGGSTLLSRGDREARALEATACEH